MSQKDQPLAESIYALAVAISQQGEMMERLMQELVESNRMLAEAIGGQSEDAEAAEQQGGSLDD